MSELPIFPLNTVLFPHTPIQLHIFESRYQLMIGKCLREKQPFGVVLIRRGAEALGPLAEPYLIGCTADILTSQPFGEGRLYLTAMGGERFHIRSLDDRSNPYLTAEVEPYPWRILAPQALPDLAENLRSRLRRYLGHLAEAGGSRLNLDARNLPDAPFEIACLAAAVLDVSPGQKQALLECESIDDFIGRLNGIYRREGVLIQALNERGEKSGQNFSLN